MRERMSGASATSHPGKKFGYYEHLATRQDNQGWYRVIYTIEVKGKLTERQIIFKLELEILKFIKGSQ